MWVVKRVILFSSAVTCLSLLFGCSAGITQNSTEQSSDSPFSIIVHEDEPVIDILFEDKLFTSYLYDEIHKKPVLYPIRTTKDHILTRGFPIDPVPGERVDHPHHVGYWLNYGKVNGLDFWNNSYAVSPEKRNRYGSIKHIEVTDKQTGSNHALLEVLCHWISYEEKILLVESSQFIFRQEGSMRIIDRTTQLTAQEDVWFEDSKEGMVAVRVNRALELPTEKSAYLVGEDGKPTADKIVDLTTMKGDYLSSSGVTGEGAWGIRAEWMRLSAEINSDQVSLVIIDHPDNIGYPTYWHARGYGLFAANPLGQAVFSNGAEKLNLTLKSGETVTFKYRLIIDQGGELPASEIDSLSADFAKMF